MLEQEQIERKKTEYGERIKNKISSVHKEAEEKRAMVQAKNDEEVLKQEEMAGKHCATANRNHSKEDTSVFCFLGPNAEVIVNI